jgi:hypothetical protein
MGISILSWLSSLDPVFSKVYAAQSLVSFQQYLLDDEDDDDDDEDDDEKDDSCPGVLSPNKYDSHDILNCKIAVLFLYLMVPVKP